MENNKLEKFLRKQIRSELSGNKLLQEQGTLFTIDDMKDYAKTLGSIGGLFANAVKFTLNTVFRAPLAIFSTNQLKKLQQNNEKYLSSTESLAASLDKTGHNFEALLLAPGFVVGNLVAGGFLRAVDGNYSSPAGGSERSTILSRLNTLFFENKNTKNNILLEQDDLSPTEVDNFLNSPEFEQIDKARKEFDENIQSTNNEIQEKVNILVDINEKIQGSKDINELLNSIPTNSDMGNIKSGLKKAWEDSNNAMGEIKNDKSAESQEIDDKKKFDIFKNSVLAMFSEKILETKTSVEEFKNEFLEMVAPNKNDALKILEKSDLSSIDELMLTFEKIDEIFKKLEQ